jgi:hypothetical protein
MVGTITLGNDEHEASFSGKASYMPFKALFINRHLNRDVWKLVSAMS